MHVRASTILPKNWICYSTTHVFVMEVGTTIRLLLHSHTEQHHGLIVNIIFLKKIIIISLNPIFEAIFKEKSKLI